LKPVHSVVHLIGRQEIQQAEFPALFAVGI
jgi:hypothetical protein